MRQEVERLKPLYPKIEILLGVEANIINPSGKLDVTEEELEQFDYLLAGYHYGVFGESPAFALGLHIQNFIMSNWLHTGTRTQRKLNTELTVRAIYENNIKILTHPGDKGSFDIGEIALACADRGTMMEISTCMIGLRWMGYGRRQRPTHGLSSAATLILRKGSAITRELWIASKKQGWTLNGW